MNKGGLIILTPPLNPSLEKCGPWQQDHRLPNIQYKRHNTNEVGKPLGKTPLK